MPWLEISPMEQRERFLSIIDWGCTPWLNSCARYGISRRLATSGSRDSRRRAAGVAGAESGPACVPAPNCRRGGHLDLRRPAPASELGARQAPRLAPASVSGGGVARHQHRRRSPGAPRLVTRRRRRRHYLHPGVVPATTTQPNDLWTATSRATSAPATASTAIPSRSPTSTPATSWRAMACSRRRNRGAPGVRAALPGVRTPRGRSAPTTGALCHNRSTASPSSTCGGSAWHPAPAAPPGPSGAERGPRAMHKTLKGRGHPSPRANLARQQRAFHHFSATSTTRSGPRRLARPDPGVALLPLPPGVPAHPPPIEYPATSSSSASPTLGRSDSRSDSCSLPPP